jgi:hypothetical protein
MSIACLQRLCCFGNDEDSVKRPEIVVISNQPEKDDQSIPESFGDSGVSLPKYGKAGSRGSVSEEDSGVGSEGHNQSDIADQTDTSSQADSPKPGLRRNNSDSDFDQILPICKNSDLTAEISEELKQMNGFSLEANATRNIMDLNLPYEENADKKKKRKRRKHRKIKECVGDEESEEVKEV